MSSIKYTKHAKQKFTVLDRHGFVVTKNDIDAVLENPDKIISQGKSEYIAQKRISEQHLLRVVYRTENSMKVVITFYPGRRDRYEN